MIPGSRLATRFPVVWYLPDVRLGDRLTYSRRVCEPFLGSRGMLAAGRVALSVMCPFRRRWVHGEAPWQLYGLALDSRVPITLHWMRGFPRPIKSVPVVSRCKHFCGLAVGCCMFAVSLQWMPPAGLVCLSGSAPKVSPAPRARKPKRCLDWSFLPMGARIRRCVCRSRIVGLPTRCGHLGGSKACCFRDPAAHRVGIDIGAGER